MDFGDDFDLMEVEFNPKEYERSKFEGLNEGVHAYEIEEKDQQTILKISSLLRTYQDHRNFPKCK